MGEYGGTVLEAEHPVHGRSSLAGEGLRGRVRASQPTAREAGTGGRDHAPARQEGDGAAADGVDSGLALEHTALDHDGAGQPREVVARER